MVNRIPNLLQRRWQFSIAAVAVCSVVVSISCWRQWSAKGAGELTDSSPSALPATLVSHNEASSKATNPAAGANPTVDDPPELELLNQIRQEIGSPLESSLFNDISSGDDAVVDSFDATYAREAAEPDDRAVVPSRDEWAPSASLRTDPLARHQSALRNAARLLDEGAADLEDVEAFELADDLRDQASQLRQRARVDANAASSELEHD